MSSAVLSTEPGGVCLVASAPGYGATTSVQQALQGSADQVRWVSLDPTVPDVLSRGLVQDVLDAPTADVSGYSSALQNLESTWFVVDGLVPDIHQELAGELQALAHRMPDTSRLVIISQVEMDVPEARLVTEDLLAFEPDEAFELIRMFNPSPTMDDVAELIEVSDGWANALISGAQLMRTQGATHWLRESAARDLLLSWWDALPQDHRELLTITAVLDELHAGPALRITGDPSVAARLEELQKCHRFVRPSEPPAGHTGTWWRRHPLLTALLRQRMDAEAVAAHSAAADWFRQTGDVRSTIGHLIEAGRLRDAGTLLIEHESVWFSTGEAPTLLTWYDRITQAHDHRIEGLLRVGWGQAMSRDIVGAGTTAARLRSEIENQRLLAEASGSEADDLLARWDAEEALLRAYLAPYHGDPATAVSAGRTAMGRPESQKWRDSDQLAPVLVARGLMWTGDSEAAEALVAGIPATAYSNDVVRELHLGGVRALALCANGKVRDAEAALGRMQQWIDAGGVDPVSIQMFAPGLAQVWVDIEAGRLQAADRRCNDLLPRAEDVGHLCDATWLLIFAAHIDIARGDYGAAIRSLARARDIAMSQTTDSALLVPVDQALALAHIASGDVVRAERLIHAMPASAQRSLLAARAGLKRQPVLTRRTLENVAATTPRIAAQRQMLLAAVHDKQSRRIAQGHLREAAAIAAEYGMRQLFVPAAGSVLELAQETALEHADANLTWLLDRSEATADASDGAHDWQLSRGELQLLTILPTRAKNVEIAALLGVSVNTVKTRLRRLYAKLGAANRDEAIERARERGLLTRVES